MKKFLTLIPLLFVAFLLSSQTVSKVKYYNWSDPATFKLSPRPIINDYGPLSDSLSKVYDNVDFYEYDGSYYAIASWADYYFWYTRKYWYLFDSPQLYSYYYHTDNNYGMASYIAGDHYSQSWYPSRISVDFEDKSIEKNRLTERYIDKLDVDKSNRRLTNYISKKNDELSKLSCDEIKQLKTDQSQQKTYSKNTVTKSYPSQLTGSNHNSKVPNEKNIINKNKPISSPNKQNFKEK